MAATLSQGATHFSSCSIDEMTTKINTLPNLGACFEYPVDAMLAARPGNPTTAARQRELHAELRPERNARIRRARRADA